MAVKSAVNNSENGVRGRAFEKGRSGNLAARVVGGTEEEVRRGVLDGAAEALPAPSLRPANWLPADRVLACSLTN